MRGTASHSEYIHLPTTLGKEVLWLFERLQRAVAGFGVLSQACKTCFVAVLSDKITA